MIGALPARRQGYANANPANLVNPSGLSPKTGNDTGTAGSYAYNGDGLRTSRTLGATTTTFAWGNATGMPVVLRDSAGNRYLYGRDLISVSDSANKKFYYHTDGLGSTTAITGSTGAVVKTYQYDAYGAVRSQTGTQPNEFTFTGEQVDSSGLEYLRARYYDGATGRFVGRDPLPLMQRYAYVGGNPVNFTDPLGLCRICDWGKDRLRDTRDVTTHVVTHPAVITNGGLVNEALGGVISAMSSCDRRSYEGGIVVYTNCAGAARWLSRKLGNPGAYTIGSFVFSEHINLDADTLAHEQAHVEQYGFFGSLFLPLDLAAEGAAGASCGFSPRCTQQRNPFEIAADLRAGTNVR
jgi:RHS repeat-associated protein